MNNATPPVASVAASPAEATAASGWRRWWRALRVPSFSATIVPIAVGSTFAATLGPINPWLVTAILIAAIACQAGANFANDYFDDRKSVDTVARPGSSTLLQSGAITPRQMRRAMILCFAVAFAVGMGIVLATSWVVFFLALGSLLLAVGYSGGPLPLSHLALGEVATFLSMGLALAVGPFLVLTGNVTRESLLIAVPNALIVTALLHVNNTRDITRDRAAGKRTVAQILGESRSHTVFVSLLGLAYAAVPVVLWRDRTLWPILMSLATLPMALDLCRRFAGAMDEGQYTAVLRGVNRLQLRFGLLLVLGLVTLVIFGRGE